MLDAGAAVALDFSVVEGRGGAGLAPRRGWRPLRSKAVRGAMEAAAVATLDAVAWWRWSSGGDGMGMGEAEWSGGGGGVVAGDGEAGWRDCGGGVEWRWRRRGQAWGCYD